MERDIAAGLSSYKQFGSQILCPKFTTTTKHKKQIYQNLMDWEGSVQCSGGDEPWSFCCSTGWILSIFLQGVEIFSVRLLKSALKIDFSTCERPTEMTKNSCCLFNTSLPYWLHTLWPENQQKSPKKHPSEKSDYMHYLHFLPKADLDTVMSKCPK